MKRKKILLVDDSNAVLTLHRLLLGAGNYELVFARNGQEAVEKATSERPDMIFMDVVMPVMDGFQAVRLLRAQEMTRNTPIVLVTTRGEEHSEQEGYAAGCNGYVHKPLQGSELIEKLHTFLGE
jgi:CheY-like chemotaxis protein